ncbi:hypothetical protein PoB_007478900 [Plakobranchus ocellatus]|uniref:Uncharacterized protein n=1 Tax=Plakobranchus ocellatus TaxID=259542 RepID=A0AAV4DW77_9GAST|nr:hypothetical protein PoB_007478900 [Plakobranchus ocellatus]
MLQHFLNRTYVLIGDTVASGSALRSARPVCRELEPSHRRPGLTEGLIMDLSRLFRGLWIPRAQEYSPGHSLTCSKTILNEPSLSTSVAYMLPGFDVIPRFRPCASAFLATRDAPGMLEGNLIIVNTEKNTRL